VADVPTPGERFDLSGKVALITGGSRGLGREMALGFAAAGADIVIASRKLDNCEKVAAEVEALGRRAMAHAVHVGRWDEVPGLVDATYDRFGKLDILVNNAGMSPLFGDLSELNEKLFDSVVNLNMKGPFRLASLVAPRMIADGGGAIINVSTSGSLRPQPHFLPYAAAKAGLNVITEALAKAYGPTVRVNTLMPGQFATDVSASWDMDAVAVGLKSHAIPRVADPSEIVGAALYLASDAASFTTGATLRVDGGIP
jgi:NAD(P)-dependent dehydrogenase (short-subunit alcohol dehydrogenase family)